MYVMLLLIIITILVLSFKSTKKLRNRNNKKILESLNNKLSRLHYKKGSDNYYKLQQKLLKAGLTISPETYQTLKLIMPVLAMITYILLKLINYINLKMGIDNLAEVARILNDESILNINFKIDFLFVLLIGITTFLLQGALPFFMAKVREKANKKEELILQTYTIMLLKTSKPIKDILVSLSERADYFKPLLKTASEKFSTDQVGALKDMKNSAPQKSEFLNICIALNQSLSGDRKLSGMYLESQRHMSREINKQVRIRKQIRNQGIGILIMSIPIAISIAVVGYPWLIYTIRAIRSMPI